MIKNTNYDLEVFIGKEKSFDIIRKMYEELEYEKFYPFEYALENISRKEEFINNFELDSSDECK